MICASEADRLNGSWNILQRMSLIVYSVVTTLVMLYILLRLFVFTSLVTKNEEPAGRELQKPARMLHQSI